LITYKRKQWQYQLTGLILISSNYSTKRLGFWLLVPVLTTECVTDLDLRSKLLVFKSILTPFEPSIIFWCTWGSFENWLEPKTKPPSGNLACPNLWNAQYQNQPQPKFVLIKSNHKISIRAIHILHLSLTLYCILYHVNDTIYNIVSLQWSKLQIKFWYENFQVSFYKPEILNQVAALEIKRKRKTLYYKIR